jgi:hypothetical protein
MSTALNARKHFDFMGAGNSYKRSGTKSTELRREAGGVGAK